MIETLYFAYGSNLDPNGMGRRCPTAVVVGRAALPDYRLTFRGVADIEPAAGKRVEGALWLCTAKDVDRLDRYEGVSGGFYRREWLQVQCNGKHVDALVYVMNPTDLDDLSLPARSYLASVARGYRAHGLPISKLRAALSRSRARVEANGVTKMRSDGRKRMRPAQPSLLRSRVQEWTDADAASMGITPATLAELKLAALEEEAA
jgi:gamma-glutamylcyclotransferase (GGCT)/AIG2-like uncharacterized protein YtfP